MVDEELVRLRRELHSNPELSQNEILTAQRIHSFVSAYHPSEIITNLGGQGLAVCYNYSQAGPTVAIRCELDALPIEEENKISHKSKVPGVSHKCGHDGHMTIVAGLSKWLQEQSFENGKVILLFQPAEEIGKGAYDMLQDNRLQSLEIDYIFALHNIPGEKMHSIITMDEGFSAEVISLSIKLEGQESHAAEPDKGISPAIGISQLVSSLSKLNAPEPEDKNYSVLTPVHIIMGEKAYGVSPARGEIHYTIRTWNTEGMSELKSRILQEVEEICRMERLEFQVDWFEHFPASENDRGCNEIIRQAAKQSALVIIEKPHPFKFGEDFGWFSKQYKAAMFGLGAGVDTPALHSRLYDFPDELISTGIEMFKGIIQKILLD